MERRDDDDAVEIRQNGDQVVGHDVVDLTGAEIDVVVATRQPKIQLLMKMMLEMVKYLNVAVDVEWVTKLSTMTRYYDQLT